MISLVRLALAGSLVLISTSLLAQQFTTHFAARFIPTSPCSTLVTVAKTNGMPLKGIDPFALDGAMNPGDSLTALVTLFERNATRQTQWLLHLQVVTPDAKEQAVTSSAPAIIYSSLGTSWSSPRRALL